MPAGSPMERILRRGHLVAGVDQNSYLFGYRRPGADRPEGFDIDVVRAVADAIFGDPEKVRYRPVSIADRLPLLQSGEVDLVVSVLTITCERREQVWMSVPYLETGQRVLVDRDDPATGLAGLAGRRVCAARGSTALQRIAHDPAEPEPVGVLSTTDCLAKLQRGEVDAISTDDALLAGIAAQDPQTRILPGPRLSEDFYGVAVHREQPDLVRFVNAVLERRVARGEWAASYRQWLSPQLGPPPRPPAGRHVG
jgi:polar amino acid transport system substrate-binding protein